MKYTAELTDTFCGELNYSWARMVEFDAPATASTSLLIRRAKKALGIQGRHAIAFETMDSIVCRVRGACLAFTIDCLGGDV